MARYFRSGLESLLFAHGCTVPTVCYGGGWNVMQIHGNVHSFSCHYGHSLNHHHHGLEVVLQTQVRSIE